MTREEHLNWAKSRAKEEIDRGDWKEAWASFMSDLHNHDELANHAGIMLGMSEIMIGSIKDCKSMWSHIEGYR